MKNKQKKPDSGAHYAGTPPIQHSEVILAQRAKPGEKKAEEKSIDEINHDDIESDRHNGSGGAFEATEREWDDEE
ncbi:MAG TPA: hypothetical protein VKQ52_05690 [Puia sp.]|nr:hypothetical protein [Puia sp.]